MVQSYLAPSTAVGLKKQSQFVGGQIYAISLITMTYEYFGGPRLRENKAKQSQLHAPEPPKRVGKRDKSLAAPPYQKDEAEIFDFEWHSEWTQT
jgi:hypothetical protein